MSARPVTPSPRQYAALLALYPPAHRLILRHGGGSPGWAVEDAAAGHTLPRPLHQGTVAALTAHGWLRIDGVCHGYITPAGRKLVEAKYGNHGQ